jgi:origin recognition complex subunit 1
MYISGVPGTGKTATVNEVIKALRKESAEPPDDGSSSKKKRKSKQTKADKSSDFTYIEVNGLKLTDPYQVYSEIYRALNDGCHASAKIAANWLEDYFSDPPDDRFIVLMVDELDLLCTKKQTILYHLFDWPNKPHTNLVVLAIANAMDLSERILNNRIASRLGLTRLTFQPYTHHQLQEIIWSRLHGTDSFDEAAAQLVARKVAAVSGDARRALDICRRAALIAEERHGTTPSKQQQSRSGKQSVRMEDVSQAVDKLLSSTRLTAIRESSQQEQILLQSVVQEFRSSGLEEADFSHVVRAHQEVCKFNRYVCPSAVELFEIAFNLYERRLILIDDNNCFLKAKVRLNVSTDDIDLALKSDA